ncbi:ferritin, lower subunit-like isoform X3 [Salvelinus fontinalis]|uniref:ferritin, lower subunit-like isoform X3 n=1 Tax=Salvelinus fontinalis TaxID=8038 RepID=UPI0024862577|nr:ferritin, lower subunit-like isoform X3 [Salvelinus fontinalis]
MKRCIPNGGSKQCTRPAGIYNLIVIFFGLPRNVLVNFIDHALSYIHLFCQQCLNKPSREDWRGGLDAITFSLEFQKTLNTSLLEVHRGANTHTDPHLCDFLEQHFLSDSHDTIKKLGDHLGSLTRLTSSETHGSMGEYLFDKHTL